MRAWRCLAIVVALLGLAASANAQCVQFDAFGNAFVAPTFVQPAFVGQPAFVAPTFVQPAFVPFGGGVNVNVPGVNVSVGNGFVPRRIRAFRGPFRSRAVIAF